MKVRLLAPTASTLHLLPGAALAEPTRYAEAWQGVAGRVGKWSAAGWAELTRAEPVADAQRRIPSVHFPHARPIDQRSRYRDLRRDALDLPLHLMVVELDPATWAVGTDLPGVPDRVVARVHDHGITIVEVDLTLDGRASRALLRPTGHRDGDAHTVTEQLVSGGEEIASAVVARWVNPLAQHLAQDDSVWFVPEGQDDTAEGPPHVRWVSRALILPGRDGEGTVARQWLAHADAGPDHAEEVSDLAEGRTESVARWLNYAFRDPGGDGLAVLDAGGRHGNRWQAMRYAQYFYAVLDGVDVALTELLMRVLTVDDTGDLSIMESEMEVIRRTSRLAVLQLHETGKYLNREVRSHREDILSGWHTEELLLSPIEEKLDLCREALADLQTRRSERTALFTDILLLAIGVTSIFGTLVALAEFGRTMAADPAFAGSDLGNNTMLAWIASQPADAILLVSSAVSVLFVALYGYVRWRQLR